jgi:hypothetical protein
VKPVKPLDGNMVYKGPTDDIGDLECTRVRPGLIKSVWRPSDDELSYLRAGGLVELQIYTEPIPPVSLNVTEPHCPECMVTMELELHRERWHFRCPTCRRWA